MKKMLLSLWLFAVIVSGNLFADSPLTSTPFSNAYMDVTNVKYASTNSLDEKLLKFLGSASGDPVHKIAVVNALSWGKTNYVTLFEAYLLKERKGLKKDVFDYLRTVSDDQPQETDQTQLLTADDLICWTYLLTMGDYNNPAKGMRAAYLSYARDKTSMAHMVVFVLIAAQKAFDEDWCRVYTIPKTMLVDETYSTNIVKQEAIDIILDYTNLYQQDCK